MSGEERAYPETPPEVETTTVVLDFHEAPEGPGRVGIDTRAWVLIELMPGSGGEPCPGCGDVHQPTVCLHAGGLSSKEHGVSSPAAVSSLLSSLAASLAMVAAEERGELG